MPGWTYCKFNSSQCSRSSSCLSHAFVVQPKTDRKQEERRGVIQQWATSGSLCTWVAMFYQLSSWPKSAWKQPWYCIPCCQTDLHHVGGCFAPSWSDHVHREQLVCVELASSIEGAITQISNCEQQSISAKIPFLAQFNSILSGATSTMPTKITLHLPFHRNFKTFLMLESKEHITMDALKELLFKVHAVIPIYIKIQRFTETFTLNLSSVKLQL